MAPRPMGHAPNLVALVSICLWLNASVVLAVDPSEQRSNGINLEWKQIFVNVLDGGPTYSLMIEPDETVMDLWRELYELEGLPDIWKATTVGDTQLDLRANLYAHIGAGNIVTMSIPERTIPLNIMVRTLNGIELPVTTYFGNTVASLKDNITQWTGIPQGEQRLLLKGKELKDERKLIHYHIGEWTKLDLGRSLEDCRQVVSIIVKTLSGATIEVDVNLADTVNGLKEKIREVTGVPVGVQRLRANERVIAGEDHLCDIGLEAGSTVYMFLYSTRITSLDQVDKLHEPPVTCPINNSRAPIFREADDVGDEPGRRSASLFKDSRNWFARSGPHTGWNPNLFDPVAHLAPNPDSLDEIERYHGIVKQDSRPEANGANRMQAVFLSAQIKLSSAVRPYRVAANLTSVNYSRQEPGITLGGGSTDASPKQPVPLGADINNWAPDAFRDSDLMRLFEVAERVRQVLARAAQTGEGILSILSQKRINDAILFSYQVALTGYPPSVEYDNAREDEVCGICLDNLTGEPAIKPACVHAFHADCIFSWAANECREKHVPSCPLCRQKFMFHYEALGKAELETPELQGKLNK